MGLDSINLRASTLLPDKELEQANTSRDGNVNERKRLLDKIQQNLAFIRFLSILKILHKHDLKIMNKIGNHLIIIRSPHIYKSKAKCP
jgi:hypothetical protein